MYVCVCGREGISGLRACVRVDVCMYISMYMYVHSDNEKSSKALEDFDRALELDPKMSHAYRAKINTLRSMGRDEDVCDNNAF